MLLTVPMVTRTGAWPKPTVDPAARSATALPITPPRILGLLSPARGTGQPPLGALPRHPRLLHEHRPGVVLAGAVPVGEDELGGLRLAHVLEPVDDPRG